MEKKAIVLWGIANCGKTTTLNHVIELLIKKRFAVVNGSVPSDYQKDTLVVLKKDSKTITVNTAGDLEKSVLSIKSCLSDVNILATHGKGKTIDAVRSIFNDSSNEKKNTDEEIIWISKSRIKSTLLQPEIVRKVNERQAEDIVWAALSLL